MVESVSQSESCGFGTILDVFSFFFFCVCQCYGTLNIIERTLLQEEEWTLKQAVDVAVSMELVETEVSQRKGP